MADVYTTGSWKPFPGEEDAFVEAWTAFADWASASKPVPELRDSLAIFETPSSS